MAGASDSTGLDSYGNATLLGGTYTHGRKAVWSVTKDAPTTDKLPPGSTYVVPPSIAAVVTERYRAGESQAAIAKALAWGLAQSGAF